MDAEAFSQAPVGELMKSFVNVKVLGGTEMAESVGERFRVRGYPTLLFVDADGNEIDRIVGYGNVETFTKEVERIRKGEGTLAALRKAHEANPDDANATLAYAKKLSSSKPKDAVVLLEKAVAGLEGKDRETETQAWLALADAAGEAGDVARAIKTYERVLDERADTKAAPDAMNGTRFFFTTDDLDPEDGIAFLRKLRKVVKEPSFAGYLDNQAGMLHIRAAENALRRTAERAKGEPEMLNFVAWEAFQRRLALKDALGWAREAVEGSKRKPEILDTLANLLFENDELDEAIAIEKEALGLVEDESMKKEFEEVLARFEAVARVRKARETGTTETPAAGAEAPGITK